MVELSTGCKQLVGVALGLRCPNSMDHCRLSMLRGDCRSTAEARAIGNTRLTKHRRSDLLQLFDFLSRCFWCPLMDFDFDRMQRQLDLLDQHWPAQVGPPIPSQGVRRVQGVIHSMTPEERRDCDLLLHEMRRKRVAKGAGVTMAEVGELLAQRQVAANALRQLPER